MSRTRRFGGRAAAWLRGPSACPGDASTGRKRRDDRGSTGVEFVILLPVIVTVLLAGPQLAMGYLAKEAAISAAQAGARAASVEGAASSAGTSAADDFLARGGAGTLENAKVTQSDTANTVTLRISGDVPDAIPLPGYRPTVDITVTQPREVFIAKAQP